MKTQNYRGVLMGAIDALYPNIYIQILIKKIISYNYNIIIALAK